MIRMIRLFYILFVLLFALPGWAATYNYYFATTGGGSTCSEGSPCATLASAQTKANSATSSDTVNLYFAEGDTWSCTTKSLSQGQECFVVNYNEATVNIDSYNNGGGSADPIFDGGVDWSTEATESACSSAPCYISYFFRFRSPGTISNVEIQNVYGSAILIDSYSGGSCATLDCADGFVLSDSTIHDIGYFGIGCNFNAGLEDSVVQRNTFYLNQRLPEKSLMAGGSQAGWGSAVHFTTEGVGANGIIRNNTVKYNLVYNIYGEGIQSKNGIAEYNVVGNTASIAIDLAPHDWDGDTTTIARYNLIVHSDRTTTPGSTYSSFGLSRQDGIRIFDEGIGDGSNTADFYVYGNTIINAVNGLSIFCTSCTATDDFSGNIRIYNNTIIDSTTKNINIADVARFDALYLYNNASVLYDRTGDKHTTSITAPGAWDISHNLFWTTGGSPTYDSGDFGTSVQTTDPDLPGEPSINWDGLTGTYWYAIDITNHLYPPSDSPLVNNGKTLSSPYATSFLTTGIDFTTVLTGDIGDLASEDNSIGAVVRAANYYIDPLCGTGGHQSCGDGTAITTPENSWGDLTITAGNDYRQLCGTTYTGTVTITNSGTSGDYIIIGAYESDGDFEDSHPSYGQYCQDGTTEKPIITDSDFVGSTFDIDASYIQVDSLQIKKGERSIWLDGNYNKIQYCRIGWGYFGVQIGNSSASTDNYIGYNYVYSDQGDPNTDGIKMSAGSDNTTVEYNVVDGWSHAGIQMSTGSVTRPENNEIRFNAIYAFDDLMDHSIEINGDNNSAHHNYLEDGGDIRISAGDGNVIAYNVVNGRSDTVELHATIIGIQAVYGDQGGEPTIDVTNSKIYGNVIYDTGTGDSKAGIGIISIAATTGVVENSLFANNVIIGPLVNEPVRVVDASNTIESNTADPDCNIFANNIAYGYDDSNYARIESNYYSSASNFNTNYDKAFSNLDTDPGLSNPSSGEFWPDDSGDDVVGNGCDMNDSGADCYDVGYSADETLLSYTTDFTASPPSVDTEEQPASWYIGAYGLPGSAPSTPNIRGMQLNSISLN